MLWRRRYKRRTMTSLGYENKRAAGVDGQVPPRFSPPPDRTPSIEDFCRHFVRCFFCRFGGPWIEDHFCEKGRELLIAVLDDHFEDRYADEERDLADMAEWRD